MALVRLPLCEINKTQFSEKKNHNQQAKHIASKQTASQPAAGNLCTRPIVAFLIRIGYIIIPIKTHSHHKK